MGRHEIEKHLKKNKVEVYVEQFKIDKLGGNASAKKFVINAINEKTDEK